MGLKLWELWVIDRAGLSLVHIRGPEAVNRQIISPILFSGILSAVETIAAESIDAIRMKDSKILILPVNEPVSFFVVGRAKFKEKDANIRKILYKIRDAFIMEFGEILSSWVGDQTIFNYFTEITEKLYF